MKINTETVIINLYGFIFPLSKYNNGAQVKQELKMDLFNILELLGGLAFFLFIGSEFVIPISKNVKNERKNVPGKLTISGNAD